MTRAWFLGLAALLAGCAGARPTTKSEMAQIAKEAPPPPAAVVQVQPDAGSQPKVTAAAKADFGEAVKFFQEQEAAGWSNEKCAAAADKFRAVAAGASKLADAFFNAAVAYERCGDAKNAESMYQKALEANPTHAQSLANLGSIYYRGGNSARAQEYFEKAIKSDTQVQVTSARNNLAWIYYTKMREPRITDADRTRFEEEARGHLQRALAINNDNVVAYTIMALVFMEGADKNKNRLDVANLLLDEGKKRSDRYAPLWNAYGLLYMRKSNVAKALEAFRQAVALDPKFSEARMNLAQVVLSFRKYDEAAEHFGEVLKLAPQDYDATVALGVSMRGLKKIVEAEDLYSKAIAIDKGKPDAYYNLGLLWKDFRTNDTDLAKNKQAYVKAKGFFQEFLVRADQAASKRQEAQDHLADCDKYVTILEQAIQALSGQPETPPPAPSPPGAAGQPGAPTVAGP